MSSHGVIDGRYLSVSVLSTTGEVLTFRGDQVGVSEIDCPGVVVGEECPVCGWVSEAWVPGDDPALAPCELSEEYAPYPPARLMGADDPVARVRAAYDVLGIGPHGGLGAW